MTVTTSSSENKINNDDIDLALDALRNCDTDFIKFDEVRKKNQRKNGSLYNNLNSIPSS